MVKANDIKR